MLYAQLSGWCRFDCVKIKCLTELIFCGWNDKVESLIILKFEVNIWRSFWNNFQAVFCFDHSTRWLTNERVSSCSCTAFSTSDQRCHVSDAASLHVLNACIKCSRCCFISVLFFCSDSQRCIENICRGKKNKTKHRVVMFDLCQPALQLWNIKMWQRQAFELNNKIGHLSLKFTALL